MRVRILATTLVCILILFGVTPTTRAAELQMPLAIGDAYVNCSSGGGVTIRDNVVIGLNGRCWGSVTIPEGVTAIGDSGFANGSTFMSFSVVLPQTLSAIGERAFFGANTTSISIPANVTSIGINAFSTSELQTVDFANGSKLTHLGDKAFDGASGLTSIIIPSGVTSIGPYTFYKASNLASITFAPGSQLTEIGDYAFYDVAKLTSISVPPGVTRIGASAFSGNYYDQPNFFRSSSLSSVTFAPGSQLTTIGQSAFYGASKLTSISLPDGVNSIGQSAFSGANSLSSVTIPSGVSTIESSTFYKASNLASITFAPGSLLTSIGNYAFFGASKLSSLTVPVGVTTIGTSAFDGAGSLSALTFASGSKVTSIGDRAFFGASKLSSLTVPVGVTRIGTSAFDGAGSLSELTFATGSKLTAVGDRAFFGASKLLSLIVPAGVTSIGVSAFENASSMSTLTFATGSKLTSVGDRAFFGAVKLSGLTVPASVTTIGDAAFSDLYTLKTVSFATGSKLTSIGDRASKNAVLLKVVAIPSTVQIIGDGAFSFTWLTTFTIPASVSDIGYNPFSGASSLSTIKVESKNKRYYISNSALIDRSLANLISFPGNSVLRTYIVPSGVISIGPEAFYRTKLDTFVVPSAVRAIGSSAFHNSSSLTNFVFLSGSRLTTIYPSTFENTTKLKSITIPAGVTALGDDAFWDSNAEKIAFLGWEPSLGIGAMGSQASIYRKRALITTAAINCRSCVNWFGRAELVYSYNFRIKIGYPVSYNRNGATSGQVVETSLYESGETVKVSSNFGNLAKSCYVFSGWNTQSNGKGANYTAGTGSFSMNYTSMVLYAKWVKSKSKACAKK